MEQEIKKEYSWINYIKYRIKNNKNFLCAITGKTGSGKSWSALSIGEMLNDDFDIHRVVFRFKDLMRDIRSGKYEGKKGICFIWDEAGVDLSNRDWQSLTNKMINFLLQTFRHRNFILIFTVPYSDFLDSASRKLFHAEFQTVSINKRKKTTNLKPKLLQYNPAMKKWYAKYLKVIKPGNGVIKVERWEVPKPTQELIDTYEEKKTGFTSDLNDEIDAKLNTLDKSGSVRKTLTPLQENVVNLWKEGEFNQSRIGEKLVKSQGQISAVFMSLRNKGYLLEEYRKENGIRIDLVNPLTTKIKLPVH